MRSDTNTGTPFGRNEVPVHQGSIRIIRKICGWLLIVWLTCLPLGMVGCSFPSQKEALNIPETRRVLKVIDNFVEYHQTKNHDLYRSTVTGMNTKSVTYISKEAFENNISSDAGQKMCKYLSQATISKIIMHEDSAGVILESPVSYAGFNEHELTLYKLEGKWYIVWDTFSDR